MTKLLNTSQAVFIGLASMLGAGVFSVFGPATFFAGPWLPLAVLIAAMVAYLNAMSISQLAAVVTRSGGVYAYARHYFGATAGFVAGCCFLIGKIGSIAAIAITVGTYLSPGFEKEIALAAVGLMTAINIAGVSRTALGAKLLAGITLGFFTLVITGAVFSGPVSSPIGVDAQPIGVLTAAAMIFFAFAGYARVATLGGEVRNPETSIPNAIKISLGIVFAIYLSLSLLLPLRLGTELSTNVSAIKSLVELTYPPAGEIVWLFASIAALGSLLALLAGMGRTFSIMAEDGELPRLFAIRNANNAPWLAELLLAVIAMILVWTGSFLQVVGISSFSILAYYAIANLAALRQPQSETNRHKAWNWAGLVLCLTLAVSVPVESILPTLASLATLLILRQVLAKPGVSR